MMRADQESVRRLAMYVSIVIRGRGILIRTLDVVNAEIGLCDKVAQTAWEEAMMTPQWVG